MVAPIFVDDQFARKPKAVSDFGTIRDSLYVYKGIHSHYFMTILYKRRDALLTYLLERDVVSLAIRDAVVVRA